MPEPAAYRQRRRRGWVFALLTLAAVVVGSRMRGTNRPARRGAVGARPAGPSAAAGAAPGSSRRAGARPTSPLTPDSGAGRSPSASLASVVDAPPPRAPVAPFLTLPSAEALGFRGPGAFALPAGGAFALPGAIGAPRVGRGALGRARRLRLGSIARAGELRWALTIAAVSVLALTFRLVGHTSNFDIFIDEITYSNIGAAVALGHGVSLYGPPFFLHPPLFFYLEGSLLDLFGGAGASRVALVYELRPIDCVIGAIDCGLVTLLIGRMVNRPVAIVAGLLMALDPFLLLWDGRVLLETLAMTTAIGGWLCLDWVARREDAGITDGSRREELIVGLGGVLFGASLLTKETYVFAGCVPLLIMLIAGAPLRRRVTGLMFTVAIGCYAVYVVSVALSGRLSAFWTQQFAGLARALGTKQITGFNQKGHHAGLGNRLSADLGMYLVSYLFIAVVCLAAVLGVYRWIRAARRGEALARQRRLAIALGAGSIGYVVYAVLLGAFEVQIFYMCMVAGLPVFATEVHASWPRLARRFRPRRLLAGCALVVCAGLAFDLAVDVHIRTTTDTSLTRMVRYVEARVHYPETIDSTDQVSAFLIQGPAIDVVTTLRGIERRRPDYVLVDENLVDLGYAPLGAGVQRWLDAHAEVVHTATSRTTGELVLYRTMYAHER